MWISVAWSKGLAQRIVYVNPGPVINKQFEGVSFSLNPHFSRKMAKKENTQRTRIFYIVKNSLRNVIKSKCDRKEERKQRKAKRKTYIDKFMYIRFLNVTICHRVNFIGNHEAISVVNKILRRASSCLLRH
jgi:restriction endonuclease